MINAIGSSQYTSTPSAAGLENQLSRYQKQLSDCVNCPVTSNTPEGRETARSLSDKISQIKSRLEDAAMAKPPAFAAPVGLRDSSSQLDSNPQAGSTTATLGNHLNIYA